MTRDELMRRYLKAYMPIEYTIRSGEVFECQLVSVHFDNETMDLWHPDLYGGFDFTVSISVLNFPRRIHKLKPVK